VIELCGDGFLGSELAAFFTGDCIPHRFSSLDVKYATNSLVGSYLRSYRASPVRAFINVSGPSVVGDSYMKRKIYEEFPKQQIQNHLEFLKQLDSPPHYVYLSSAAVYGDCTTRPGREGQSLGPESPYAIGKVAAEQALLNYENYPGVITILRGTSIFSENLKTRVLGCIREQILFTKNVELGGTGEERRDFLHTSDFYSALRLILNTGKKNTVQIFNLGSGTEIKIMDLAEIATSVAQEIMGINVPIKFNQISRPGDPKTISVNLDKLHSIGWKPEFDLELLLRKYFKSFLQKHLEN